MAFVATKPSSPDVGQTAPQNGVYIVQMLAAPAVTYIGRHRMGTTPQNRARAKRLTHSHANTLSYVGYLKGKHDEALRKVRGGAKIYDYTYQLQWLCRKAY